MLVVKQSVEETIAVIACPSCGRSNRVGVPCPTCIVADGAPAVSLRNEIPLPPQMRRIEEVIPEATAPVDAATVAAQRTTKEQAATEAASTAAQPKAARLVCKNCGTEAKEGISFCLGCGASGDYVTMSRTADTSTAKEKTAATAGRMAASLRQRFSESFAETKRWSRVNAVLSLLFPGVGQILNGQVAKGIVLIVLVQLAVINLHWSAFSLPILAIRILCGVDAFNIAERRRKGRRTTDWQWDFKV